MVRKKLIHPVIAAVVPAVSGGNDEPDYPARF
jgi:hypothetical protein